MLKRDIVFRGKSIEPSTEWKWWYGSLLVHGRCYYIFPENPITPLGIVKYRVDPETVGQYTGMTDKNGTKIFEGDILLEKGKVNNGDTGAIDVESKRIVSIENASDGYMCVVSNYRSLVHHKTIEVIGNIHGNNF